ncbi:helix-turn-helix transcriptional regulator [Peptacetobacter hiranonis]|uniref:helix-turn-helix domain-containing protein n=1 Tax=Peptacetobacter hiranonis TaxID=89152 RepID=UPI002E7AA9EC|nr:helix-turn-helix transcriptional regulator [Peptacetobacter hiranonis]MEE0248942.1 helix-turn-helix transcriptional regulator [Peptacetobacter hiranonis]
MHKEKLLELNEAYLLNLFEQEISEKKKVSKLLKIGSEGFIIKNLRLKKELTQKELAKETGISENSIYNYENGKTKPTKTNWDKLTTFLEINPKFKDNLSVLMFIEENTLNTYKKALSKENDIEKIAKKINTFGDDIFIKIIIPHCISERKMNIREIDNLLNGYNIAKNNLKYSIELSNMEILKTKEKIPYFLIKENIGSDSNFGYLITIDEYIDEFLIPLSNFFDFIYKNISDVRDEAFEDEEEIYNVECKILLAKLISSNKEGGSDE